MPVICRIYASKCNATKTISRRSYLQDMGFQNLYVLTVGHNLQMHYLLNLPQIGNLITTHVHLGITKVKAKQKHTVTHPSMHICAPQWNFGANGHYTPQHHSIYGTQTHMVQLTVTILISVPSQVLHIMTAEAAERNHCSCQMDCLCPQ